MRTLEVHYLPQFVSESDLGGGTVVVIDLLRASTTICHALAAGASQVRAFLDIAGVLKAAEGEDRESLILGGERGGELIEGFDLGNSPAEYTAAEVFGKQVFFTTTNGTAALTHARIANRVVVGAAVNLASVVDAVAGDEHVHLLCAGTNGHVTREDQLAAGALATGLMAIAEDRPATNDQANAVLGEWQELLNTARVLGRLPTDQLAIELRTTPGGKNLIALGMDNDLPLCAAIDTLDLVPEYDPRSGIITA
ncbi:MAG: 2-phosphosulfolactate phosphatase [Planctomycetota bacterium]